MKYKRIFLGLMGSFLILLPIAGAAQEETLGKNAEEAAAEAVDRQALFERFQFLAGSLNEMPRAPEMGETLILPDLQTEPPKQES